jgi:hypothetical protein
MQGVKLWLTRSGCNGRVTSTIPPAALDMVFRSYAQLRRRALEPYDGRLQDSVRSSSLLAKT